MKTARDVMQRNVISVAPTASITDVARTLNENGISGCPVIDFNGTLRGIISRTNILDHALTVESASIHPVLRILIPGTANEEDVFAPRSDLDDVPQAQEIMSDDVILVAPETPLHEVAAVMSDERVHRVPVVDSGRVLGIITSLDLLGAFPAPTAAGEAAFHEAGQG